MCVSQCAENLFFPKLFASSVCRHLFVSVVFIFLSVDSIITIMKRLLKVSIAKARLMPLRCHWWQELLTITLDGCSRAVVDTAIKGTFELKEHFTFFSFNLPEDCKFKVFKQSKDLKRFVPKCVSACSLFTCFVVVVAWGIHDVFCRNGSLLMVCLCLCLYYYNVI